MKTLTGLWIDHSKALIVTITDIEEVIKVIGSDVEKQLRRTGDSILKGSFESLQVKADDIQQKAYTENINSFYDEVIDSLGDAKSILILGPAEAKAELKKRMEKNKLGNNIAGVETADNMTDGQLVAYVREFFNQ